MYTDASHREKVEVLIQLYSSQSEKVLALNECTYSVKVKSSSLKDFSSSYFCVTDLRFLS